MLLISHRGNVSGRNPERENEPKYIEKAINAGFMVECDLWKFQLTDLYLGHDSQGKLYKIDKKWLEKHSQKLLIHCKNIEAVKTCQEIGLLHYFYHNVDDYAVSSWGKLISHSNNGNDRPHKYANTILMLPERFGLSKESLKNCAGICSDIIDFYK